ncbi:hypothetical protein CEXT_364851 [Caerostris extrusa]|uniref:Uncharacterized protein n=1 Tax=Caerostris extrusa TaxID=172846 RepID=A0AAV4QH59_CAEEX|nr:hypothetical protein CEXT_364851 [Caerostris extrusa]
MARRVSHRQCLNFRNGKKKYVAKRNTAWAATGMVRAGTIHKYSRWFLKMKAFHDPLVRVRVKAGCSADSRCVTDSSYAWGVYHLLRSNKRLSSRCSTTTSWHLKLEDAWLPFPFGADGRVGKMKRENQFRPLDRRSRNSELEGGSQQNTGPAICDGSCHFSS